MYSIYKKEISGYFNSFIGYLAIGLFLLINGLLIWVFPDSSILDSGYAMLHHKHVTGADTGADLDFLKGCRGAPVGRDSH